jgi:hypothetical protein
MDNSGNAAKRSQPGAKQMPSMTTTIGRGLQAVQVEYDIWDDTTDDLSVEVQEVFLFANSANKEQPSKVDVSGLLTDSVYQSLEADCLAHEINVRNREKNEPKEPSIKQHTLSHYLLQASLAGAV